MTSTTENVRTVANKSQQESFLYMTHREVVHSPNTVVADLPGKWSPRTDGVVGLVLEASSGDAISVNGEPVDGTAKVTLGDTVTVGKNITVYTTPNDHGAGDWINIFDYADTRLADRFEGIDEYPSDESWVVPARFVPNSGDPVTSSFNRVRDGDKEFVLPTPGSYHVTIADRDYALEVVPYAGQHYLFFKDATTGRESHPVGRVLVIFESDLSSVSTLDFNQAKLSPCALNDILSCPLPPASNTIAVPVRAGQRDALFRPTD